MAATYPDKTAATYPDETAATYLNKMPNLSELKNPRGVRLSHPKISKRFSGIIREAADRPSPVPPRQKLKGFKLIIKLIRDNKKAKTVKTEILREKARAKQDG